MEERKLKQVENWKNWKTQNPVAYQQSRLKYYRKDKDKILERNRMRYLNNLQKSREDSRKYYHKNKINKEYNIVFK